MQSHVKTRPMDPTAIRSTSRHMTHADTSTRAKKPPTLVRKTPMPAGKSPRLAGKTATPAGKNLTPVAKPLKVASPEKPRPKKAAGSAQRPLREGQLPGIDSHTSASTSAVPPERPTRGREKGNEKGKTSEKEKDAGVDRRRRCTDTSLAAAGSPRGPLPEAGPGRQGATRLPSLLAATQRVSLGGGGEASNGSSSGRHMATPMSGGGEAWNGSSSGRHTATPTCGGVEARIGSSSGRHMATPMSGGGLAATMPRPSSRGAPLEALQFLPTSLAPASSFLPRTVEEGPPLASPGKRPSAGPCAHALPDEEEEEEEDEEEEDEDEEDEEEESEYEDDEEEAYSSEEGSESTGCFSDAGSVTLHCRRRGRRLSHKGSAKGAGGANRQRICLTVKVSREGDRNVKLFNIFRNTSFLRFAEEVMWRFRYEELEEFDMYCIDAAGDHVDIDRKQDFEDLTAPYWERLKQMQEAQRQHTEENTNHLMGLSNPLNNTINSHQQINKLLSEEEVLDDGRSTETVIRLFVRNACTHHRGYPPAHDASAGRSSLVGPLHLGTADGGGFALDASLSTGKVRVPHIEEVPKAGAGPKRRSVSETGMLGYVDPFWNSAGNDGEAGSTPSSAPHLPSKRCSVLETMRTAIAPQASDIFRVCAMNQLQWTRMAVIGKGSFGTVYEGITTDGKLMAVKVQELPMHDSADEIHTMQSEMNLLCSMVHKNIVEYYGCQVIQLGGGSRQMEIFLELCHGGTLSQMRRRFERARKPFSMSLVRAYTRQILEGLAYLHSCNVMHRDVKGDNVLISATGEAKLSDFGCSKRIGTTSLGQGLTREGQGVEEAAAAAAAHQSIVGSPLFMAPEVLQASGTQSGGYSMAADIWSVGCVVLELLGREPWSVSGRNVFQLMFHIAQAKGLPNGVPTRCPAALLDFFHMCFERDPTRRWTAAQLLKHPWMVCPESELEEVPPDSNPEK